MSASLPDCLPHVRVNEELMAAAGKDAPFLHCLPAEQTSAAHPGGLSQDFCVPA